MKVILTGGGTIGSVSPLLAVKEALEDKSDDLKFYWIGTKDGIEKDIVVKENIHYIGISSGKLRRYFDWNNLLDPFRILAGFFQAYRIIKEIQPDIILSAGGFVSVPVIWAAWILGKKSIIHQQDIRPGLANLLTVRCASRVTVTFKKSLLDFPVNKAIQLGNPVRKSILDGDKARAIKRFGLELKLPTLLILGGSLGADFINQLLANSIRRLFDDCQIIHLTGKGNSNKYFEDKLYGEKGDRYHQYEYLHEEMADAYAAADLVVCRAGLSTLTEVAAWRKPAIIIPIPKHQQEENAKYFQDKNAAIVLDQNSTASDQFVSLVREIIRNRRILSQLQVKLHKLFPENSSELYVDLINHELSKNNKKK